MKTKIIWTGIATMILSYIALVVLTFKLELWN